MLDDCLARLFKSTPTFTFEVIVIDNGSTDDSAGMVAEKYPTVRLVRNESNRFFAYAHNQAFALSAAPYVLILNSDILVNPDTLQALVTFLDEHPDAGGVGARLLDSEGRATITCWKAPTVRGNLIDQTLLRQILTSKRFDQYGPDEWDGESPKEVEVVTDACLCVRRQVLEDLGGYDDRLLLYYTEDDLCLRMRKVGWHVYINPSALAVHLGQHSSNRVPRSKILRIRRRDAKYYFNKHHGRSAAVAINLAYIADLAIHVPLRRIKKALRLGTGRHL